MTTLNATEACSRLYRLIDEATQSHRPITITGKRGNAVLVAEQDWNAINETLFLLRYRQRKWIVSSTMMPKVIAATTGHRKRRRTEG